MSDAIDELIEREGGFTDTPDDSGGPTNMGITQATLARWRKQPVTAEDVRNLQRPEARAIYEAEYLTGPKIDRISHTTLRDFVLDIAVMSGPGTAIMLLQRCLRDEHGQALLADGVIGSNTLRALWGCDEPEVLVTRLVRQRVIWLIDVAQHDPSQLKWLEGWATRTLNWLPGIKE
jgi:lysozyme family protein